MAIASLLAPEVASMPLDPDSLYEVVASRVVEKPPMGAYQAEVASLLWSFLSLHLREHRVGRALSETLFVLDKDRGLKRRPDLAIVTRERWPLDQWAPHEEAWDVVPELAIEVNSPSTTIDGLLQKVDEYFQAGVQVVWVLFPVRRLVYVYQSPTNVEVISIEGVLHGGTVLPDFHLPLSELFEAKERAE